MATAVELREQIAQARRDMEEAQRQDRLLTDECVQAQQRQDLRRELDSIRSDVSFQKFKNSQTQRRRQAIDADVTGQHPSNGRPSTEPSQQPQPPVTRVKNDGMLDVTSSISKGEYIWRLQGMSWLENAMAEHGEELVCSDDFHVGPSFFDLVYTPKRGPLEEVNNKVFSLAIRHVQAVGIIFRYKIFILKAGGDFVQWGEERNECHPTWFEHGKAFGPDLQESPGHGSQPAHPLGIFGCTHEGLVKSEWVEKDTLTVKVQIEVMEDSSVETEALIAFVAVPPPTIAANLLSMLEDARHADTTFIVEEREIKAHSHILAARSEVFDKELHGSMQESLSKTVDIKDTDFATFDVFLRFLYTDDLDRVEASIKNQVSSCTTTACGDSTFATNARTVTLQNILAVSHKYQVQRLRLWCEQQLCECISKDEVCSILCQAHLYDAKQLEKACLGFIKDNMDDVMATRSFGSFSAEWPEVLLKINIFVAGLSEGKASEVTAAHEESRKKRGIRQNADDVATASAKRARTE